jgi:hypothetical protein
VNKTFTSDPTDFLLALVSRLDEVFEFLGLISSWERVPYKKLLVGEWIGTGKEERIYHMCKNFVSRLDDIHNGSCELDGQHERHRYEYNHETHSCEITLGGFKVKYAASDVQGSEGKVRRKRGRRGREGQGEELGRAKERKGRKNRGGH